MPPPRYRSRPAAALPNAGALLPRCCASITTAVAVLPMPPQTPSTSPPPVHPLALALAIALTLALALALATAPANATLIALTTATAKTALAPALVNVTGPRPKARRAGTAPSPPPASSPRLSSAAVARRGPGDGPRRRGWGSSWSKGGGIEDDDGCHRRQPLSPLSLLPPSPPPPMPPPPCPHPCLRRHYRCSLCQRHCVSNAPVNGWLLCRLLPLAYCVVRRPNLSAPAIVRSLTLSPPGRRPLLLLLFYRASIAFAAPVDGWLLHSPPTQQHTDHLTKLKTFPVSTLLDLF
jgi:hypothetical protein